MKNKIVFVVILAAFISGALMILAMPNEVSSQVKQLFVIGPINAPSQEAFATSNLINVQVSPSNNFIQSQSYYGISFTVPNDNTPGKTLEIQFPAGFVLTNAIPVILPGFTGETFSVSGQKILLTLPSDEPWANDSVQLLVGGIVNPSILNNKISIDIKNSGGTIIFGPTLSPVFTLTGIKSSMINSGAITTTNIANGVITQAKMAFNSVNTTQIVNGAITQAKLANGTLTDVIRFSSGTNNQAPISGDFINYGTILAIVDVRGASSIVGINGTITKFHFDVGQAASIGGDTVTAVIYKNGVDTGLSCSIITGAPKTCESNTPLNVNSGDLIAVFEKCSACSGSPIGEKKAFVLIHES